MAVGIAQPLTKGIDRAKITANTEGDHDETIHTIRLHSIRFTYILDQAPDSPPPIQPAWTKSYLVPAE